MRDLYTALGSIVAAAHANGHTVSRTRRPEQGSAAGHSVDVDADSYLVRFEAEVDEPRFKAMTVYPFDAVLRDSYTPAELTNRVDSEFQSLDADERERAVQSIVQADLQEVQEARSVFERRCNDEIGLDAPEVRCLTYGEQGLWNGFIVRDHVFPYDGLTPTEYRQVVNRIERTTRRTRGIVHEVTDVLDREGDHEEELLHERSQSPAFQ